MHATTTEHDLLDRLGLTARAAVMTARPQAGRARCSQIRLTDGTQLFVKQDRPGRTDTDTVAEGENVRALRAAGLLDVTPEVLGLAPGGVVYRGFPDLPTLTARPDLAAGAAPALGRALAQVHGAAAGLRPTGALARSTLDWITVTPRSLAMYPNGYREVWARVDEARPALLDLARHWRATAVIHGDIKADNILLTLTDPPRVILIDWETAGTGDPLWDLGCAVGDRVWAWREQLPLTAGGSLADWLADSPTPLASIGAHARALLAGYGDPVDPARVAAYAGAFLLQRAVTYGMHTSQLPARARLTAHLSTQFLTHPERTAEILL